MDREIKQIRMVPCDLKTRAEPEGDELVIEGYFAVFNQRTELFPGGYEEIAPEAFDKTLGNDIRALTNHDATLVLGRNKAGTLELKVDSHGLYGSIKINQEDTDAMNTHARVKRGDVDQCSFGFFINSEETKWNDDGTVLWRLNEIDLHEVSICTFPQYEQTGVQARTAEYQQHKDKVLETRKQKAKERLKNGTKTNNAKQEN